VSILTARDWEADVRDVLYLSLSLSIALAVGCGVESEPVGSTQAELRDLDTIEAQFLALLNDYRVTMDEDVSDPDVFAHGDALFEKLRRYGCRKAPVHLLDLSSDSRAGRSDRSDQLR